MRIANFLKRVFCWLTGGHKYASITLETYYDPVNMKFLFRNRCVKCGTYKTWDVPEEAIMRDVHRRLYANIDEVTDG